MEPYRPINTLKRVADEVWIVDGPIIAFRYLGLHLSFPTRTTVVRLTGGDLWGHSPTELTPALRAEVDALGPVRHLIAPNRIHYWWVADWQRAFRTHWRMPRREPGERQRHAARASIAISRTGPIQPGPARIEQLLVRGSYLTEAVFFHRASRSLILADLIESFEADKVRGPWLRLAIRLGGCLHPDGVMPRDLRLTFIGRRRDLRRAVARMVDWQPRRVIIAHGRWYAEDGARELERAFCWLGPLA